MHELQALALDLFDHDGKNGLLAFLVLRQEDQSCTVLALLRNWNTLKQYKLVGNLQQNTCTVAGLSVSALSATMAQVFEHFQGVVDELVRLAAVDIHHHTYAARIVLIGAVVQSISLHLLTYLVISLSN